VVGQVTPNMLEKLKFGTYIFFAAFCLIMFLWVLFFVPETRYKTLEEIMAQVGLEPTSAQLDDMVQDAKDAVKEHVEKAV
jgi:hypothetical protein